MALTVLEPAEASPAYLLAAVALGRAAIQLAMHGLRYFGRPAIIDRRTGRVRPA